jgi:membrane-bound metal-dependent hydrolase YbcI (DUF457 family)
MPTFIAHWFCGFLFYPETQKPVFKNKIYAGSFIGCLPDFDYYMGMFAGGLKVGHRSLTHSFFSPLIIDIVSGTVAKLMKKIFSFDHLFNEYSYSFGFFVFR